MKKFYISLSIVIFFFFIWFIINSGEISEINEVREIANRKEKGLFQLTKNQQTKLDNFILDIAEIKIRECSAGAKFISIKCAFPDKVAEYTLGNKLYQDVLNEIQRKNYSKNANNGLFQEINSDEFICGNDKISQDYCDEFKVLYKERMKNVRN